VILPHNIERYQYAFTAAALGLALMMLFLLGYVAFWRPRSRDLSDEERQTPEWRQVWSAIPWVIIATLAAALVFETLQTVFKALYPPNNW